METLPLRLLSCITPAFLEHQLAILNNFVLLYDLLVLVTFEFGEGVCIFCFVLLTFELASELFSFRGLGLDQLLLLADDLLEGPASLHPALQVLLNLLVSHLPSFHFLAYMTCLLG